MSGADATNPATQTADTPQLLLEHHLKNCGCPPSCASTTRWRGSAPSNRWTIQRYLLRMAELELLERERRAIERRIRQAKFPVVKTMDSFDFLAIPSLNKTLVLELARCEFLARRENVLLLGNSGTGQDAHRTGSRPGRLPAWPPRPLHHRRRAGQRADRGARREEAAALPEADRQLRTAHRR